MATSTNSQKLGLMNAVSVNAIQTLRLREKSCSAMNRRQMGLAMANTAIAIANTTIIAFKLVIMAASLLERRPVHSEIVVEVDQIASTLVGCGDLSPLFRSSAPRVQLEPLGRSDRHSVARRFRVEGNLVSRFQNGSGAQRPPGRTIRSGPAKVASCAAASPWAVDW